MPKIIFHSSLVKEVDYLLLAWIHTNCHNVGMDPHINVTESCPRGRGSSW